jgi:hypothetical protein
MKGSNVTVAHLWKSHIYIHTYISVCFSAGSPRGSQAPEGRAGEKGVRGAPMEDVPRQGEAGGYEVRVVLNSILSFTKLLSLYGASHCFCW